MIFDLLPGSDDKSKITTEVAGQTGDQPVMILDSLSLHGYKCKITTESLVPDETGNDGGTFLPLALASR